MRAITRRQLLHSLALSGAACGVGALLSAWARSATAGLGDDASPGRDLALTIGRTPFRVDGRMGHAVTVNGTVPGPLVRLRQGQTARIAVTNELDEPTSIHWHGVILPFQTWTACRA